LGIPLPYSNTIGAVFTLRKPIPVFTRLFCRALTSHMSPFVVKLYCVLTVVIFSPEFLRNNKGRHRKKFTTHQSSGVLKHFVTISSIFSLVARSDSLSLLLAFFSGLFRFS
ncbi:unnamed protein product, partial [Ectocarpus sp. 4 AP-2014]